MPGCWLLARLPGWFAGWKVSSFVDWSAGYSGVAGLCWLAAWLGGRSACWPVGLLVGWLVDLLAGPLCTVVGVGAWLAPELAC